jgi:hypothetical protein
LIALLAIFSAASGASIGFFVGPLVVPADRVGHAHAGTIQVTDCY